MRNTLVNTLLDCLDANAQILTVSKRLYLQKTDPTRSNVVKLVNHANALFAFIAIQFTRVTSPTLMLYDHVPIWTIFPSSVSFLASHHTLEGRHNNLALNSNVIAVCSLSTFSTLEHSGSATIHYRLSPHFLFRQAASHLMNFGSSCFSMLRLRRHSSHSYGETSEHTIRKPTATVQFPQLFAQGALSVFVLAIAPQPFLQWYSTARS